MALRKKVRKPKLTKHKKAKGPEGSLKPRGNWLGPYCEEWLVVYPGSVLPGGMMARYLRPLDVQHGVAVARRHLGNYLRSTPPDFISLARFAATFSAWDHIRVRGGGSQWEPRPEETADQYLRRVTSYE